MTFIVFGWFGIFWTVLTLALCFLSTVVVEFSLGSLRQRRMVIGVSAVSCFVWLIVIVERFVVISQ